MTQTTAILADCFDDALVYASRIHREHIRKGSGLPYVSHLLGVVSIALENGANEDQAIAALLHDTVEDQGGADRLVDIRERYGDRVAEIVAHCTDSEVEPKPSWRERKEAYLVGLSKKPVASLEVSIADKTHNAGAIVADLHLRGDQVWPRFTGGKDGSLWYYRELSRAFAELAPGTASDRATVEEMTQPQTSEGRGLQRPVPQKSSGAQRLSGRSKGHLTKPKMPINLSSREGEWRAIERVMKGQKA